MVSCKTTSRDETIKDGEYNKNQKEDISTRRIITTTQLSSTGEISYDLFDVKLSYNQYLTNFSTDYFDAELFPYKYNSKYGYADANGNVVISEKYDSAYPFSENKAFVIINNQLKVIDTAGKELFTVPDKYLYYAENCFFQNGKAILAYYTNPRFDEFYVNAIVINKDFTVSEFKIDITEISYYNNVDVRVLNTPEFAGVLVSYIYGNSEKTDYHFCLYDTTGKEVWKTTDTFTGVPPRGISDAITKELALSLKQYSFNEIYGFSAKNGFMNVVDENKKWGLLNLNTHEIELPYKYDFVGVYSDEVVPVCSYGKWGYVDINGNEIIEPKYKYATEFVDGKANVITDDGSCCSIDKKGNIISTFDIVLGDENYISSYFDELDVCFVVTDDNVSVYTFNGEYLVGSSEKNNIYFSKEYIFINDSMYKVEN